MTPEKFMSKEPMKYANLNNNDLISKLNDLVSENQNPNTLDIDIIPTLDVVKKINQQDHLVSLAIEKILPELAKSVDIIVEAFNKGGRLVYIGAGTSGRLGVLDAVECVPTFGVPDDMVVAVIAGGESAMFKAKEGTEDRKSCGMDDLKAINLNDKDVLVGIAASGRTPYVIGGLEYALSIGAKRVALSCNPNAEISEYADVSLLPIVGPEALTGSTRMKSGSAQKMVLNMLSTAAMIRMGKSYRNLMVDVKTTNEKLVARGTRIVMQITGVEEAVAKQTLIDANQQVKLAILMLLSNVDSVKGELLLKESEGFLRKALMLN
jgi:N-acetylmuramic acid 6-phosphate etherase